MPFGAVFSKGLSVFHEVNELPVSQSRDIGKIMMR